MSQLPDRFGSADPPDPDWPLEIHRVLADHRVSVVSYVPDAGHKRLIGLCQDDPRMRIVPLTTEEEGVGLAMGAWLGGEKSVLLLQSSGVGNLVNVLGAIRECGFPFVMLVTMRGEEGEENPWQVPMGRATPKVLEAMGIGVVRVEEAGRAGATVDEVLAEAFDSESGMALLLSQRLLGIKAFPESGGAHGE